MATASVDPGTILRCPICLAMMSVGAGRLPQSMLTCPKCHRKFEKHEGLPYKPPSAAPAAAPEAPEAGVEPSKPVRWSGHIALAAGGLALTLWLGLDMKGPDFLLFYFFVWVVTFVGTLIFKVFPWANYAGVVGLIIFEGLGFARVITGAQKGMHKFGILFVMMLIGGITYAIRLVAEHSEGGCSVGGCSSSGCSSAGFWSSGSGCSSSSCGGGGCGGGGCGGCS